MKLVIRKPNLSTKEFNRILENPPIRLKKATEKYDKLVKGRPFVMIVNDFAGLELRIGCLYHHDPRMIELLSDPNEDMHQNTADEIGINRDPDAKECNFLLQFGGRGFALAESITNKGVPTTPQQGDSYKIRYDQLYPNVKQQREYWLAEHQKFGFITYFTGRRRSVPNIDWNNRSSVHRAETTLANNAIQGVGQDFLKAAIIRTDHRCINVDKAVLNEGDIITMSSTIPGYGRYGRDHLLLLKDYARKVEKARKIFKSAKLQYALQVHDELVHFCLAEAYEEVAPMISEMMCWRHPFPRHPVYRYCVPLVAEGGVGYNWLQAKGKDKKNPPILSLKEGYNSYELEKP